MPSLIFLENCGFNKEEKMGPLTPDIISNNLNLIVALLIGIAFGAILEQAGFSSSKKIRRVFLWIRFYGFESFFFFRDYGNDWNYGFKLFWFFRC